MADKRPLVVINGIPAELPSADTLLATALKVTDTVSIGGSATVGNGLSVTGPITGDTFNASDGTSRIVLSVGAGQQKNFYLATNEHIFRVNGVDTALVNSEGLYLGTKTITSGSISVTGDFAASGALTLGSGKITMDGAFGRIYLGELAGTFSTLDAGIAVTARTGATVPAIVVKANAAQTGPTHAIQVWKNSDNLEVASVNSGGGITANDLTVSGQINIPAPTEQITNGHFTTDTTGWNAVAASTIEAIGGELVISSTASTGTANASQMRSLVPGKTYRIVGKVRQGTATAPIALMVGSNSDLSGEVFFKTASTTTMTELSGTFTATAATMYVGARNTNVTAVGQTHMLDDVSLMEVRDSSLGGALSVTTLTASGAISGGNGAFSGNLSSTGVLDVGGIDARFGPTGGKRIRLVHHADVNYIQAGASNADTAAELRITRFTTAEGKLAAFKVYADNISLFGNVNATAGATFKGYVTSVDNSVLIQSDSGSGYVTARGVGSAELPLRLRGSSLIWEQNGTALASFTGTGLSVTGNVTASGSFTAGANQFFGSGRIAGRMNLALDDLTSHFYFGLSRDQGGSATDIATRFNGLKVYNRAGVNATSSASNIGFFADSTNSTASTEIVTIDGHTQRVGIGTTTPAERLDVSGNIRATGGIAADFGLTVKGKITVPAPTEQILNGKFPADVANWTAQRSTIAWEAGRLKMLGDGTNADPWTLSNEMTVVPGKTYRVLGDIERIGTAGTMFLRLFKAPYTGADEIAGGIATTENGSKSFLVTIPAGVTKVKLTLQLGHGAPTPTTSGAYLDNASTIEVRHTSLGDNLGIGVTSAAARLHVLSPTPNGGATPAAPEPIVLLHRDGVANESFSNFATLLVSRYENAGTDARTALTFNLRHTSEGVGLGTNVLTLRSNGNVGIGITNPQYALQVNGAISSANANAYQTIALSHPTGNYSLIRATSPNSTHAQLRFQSQVDGTGAVTDRMVIDGSGLVSMYAGLSVTGNGSISGAFSAREIVVAGTVPLVELRDTDGSVDQRRFRQSIAGNLFVLDARNDVGAQQRVLLAAQHSTGNVGIGTASPQGKLDVFSSNGRIIFGNATTVSGALGFTAVNAGITAPIAFELKALSHQFTTYNGSVNIVALNITGSGNVGIGTTSPAERLDVAGNMRSVGVLVGTSPQKVVNGHFDVDISSWSLGNGAVGSLSWQAGKIRVTRETAGSNWPNARQTITGLVVGRNYEIVSELSNPSALDGYQAIAGINSSTMRSTATSATLRSTFTATATSHNLDIGIWEASGAVAQYVEFDNVSIKEVATSEQLNVLGPLSARAGISVIGKAATVTNPDQIDARLTITNTGNLGRSYSIISGRHNVSQAGFSIYDHTAGAERLRISDTGLLYANAGLFVTGDATASGNILTAGSLVAFKDREGYVQIGGDDNGKIEIGKPGRSAAGTPFIDFHSSANSHDYDVRIIASGGTATVGHGALEIQARGGVTVTGNGTFSGNLSIGNTFSNARLNFVANDTANLIATSRSDGTQIGYIHSNGWQNFYTSRGFGVGMAPPPGSAHFYALSNAEVRGGALIGTPAQLVQNPGFATDTIWAKGAGWTIDTVAGVAVSNATTGYESISQALSTLTPGKAYEISFQITEYTSGAASVFIGTSGSADAVSVTGGAIGTFKKQGVFKSGQNKAVAVRQENGFVGKIDNIVVTEIATSGLLSVLGDVFSTGAIKAADLTARGGYLFVGEEGTDNSIIRMFHNPNVSPGYVQIRAWNSHVEYDAGQHRFRNNGGGTQWASIGSAGLSVTGDGIISGNVGIGTASPAEKLHINGNARFDLAGAGTPRWQFGSAADNGHLTGYRFAGVGSDYWASRIEMRDKFVIQTGGQAAIGSHTFVDRLVVDGNGLSVTGTLESTGANASLRLPSRDTGGAWLWYNSGGVLRAYDVANNNDRLTISSTGVTATGPVRPGTYTVATLPAPASHTNAQAAVTDGTRPNRPVFSDGTNWRYVSDDVIVS